MELGQAWLEASQMCDPNINDLDLTHPYTNSAAMVPHC